MLAHPQSKQVRPARAGHILGRMQAETRSAIREEMRLEGRAGLARGRDPQKTVLRHDEVVVHGSEDEARRRVPGDVLLLQAACRARVEIVPSAGKKGRSDRTQMDQALIGGCCGAGEQGVPAAQENLPFDIQLTSFDDLPALDDEPDIADGVHVARRIALDRDEIGEEAGLDCAPVDEVKDARIT